MPLFAELPAQHQGPSQPASRCTHAGPWHNARHRIRAHACTIGIKRCTAPLAQGKAQRSLSTTSPRLVGTASFRDRQALEREGVRQWPASRMQASTSCSSSNTSTQYCSMSMLTCPGNQAVRTASMRSDSSIQATSRGPPWMSTTMMEVLVTVATVCSRQASKVFTGEQQDDDVCHGVVAGRR